MAALIQKPSVPRSPSEISNHARARSASPQPPLAGAASQHTLRPTSPAGGTIHSVTSIKKRGSNRRVIVTTPPWARHEQPMPYDESLLSPTSVTFNRPPTRASSHLDGSADANGRPSDNASLTSSAVVADNTSSSTQGGNPSDPQLGAADGADAPTGSWWTFVLPRLRSSTKDDTQVPEEVEEEEDTTSESDPPANEDEFPSDVEDGRKRFRAGYSRSEKGKQKAWDNSKEKTPSSNRTSWLFRYGTSQGTPKRGNTLEGSAAGDINEKSEEAQASTSPGGANIDDDTPTSAEPPSLKPPKRTRRPLPRRRSSNILRLDIPLPRAPFTLAQTKTPGWDSPWAPGKYKLPSTEESLPRRSSLTRIASTGGLSEISSGRSTRRRTARYRRKKWWKNLLLYNNYVPLFFRLINLAFTSATLGIAARVRQVEAHHHIRGALGSSATVAIIFAPITIVHVLIAIYLEYWGRPLGLWKASAKLMHTLSEVLFIICWSSALSLSFDDYITSPLRCISDEASEWWNELPIPTNPLPEDDRQVGKTLCHEQAALIALVFISLATYSSNLVINLFRIIEKVKYRTRRTPTGLE